MGSWSSWTLLTPWSSWSAWRSPSLLGLDLADDCLRVVELQQRGDALLLCAAGTQPLPPGCVVDGDIQQFDAVAAALDQCLQQHPTRTRDVAMALPTAAVRLDIWQAPLGLSGESLAAFVAEQVVQQWSAEPETLSLDYSYVVDSMDPAEQGRLWVAAAPVELVQDRQGLAEACGLRLTDLESRAQARGRVWQVPAPSSGFAVHASALAQPFDGMRLGPKLVPQGWPSDAAPYSVACGLALRRFMA